MPTTAPSPELPPSLRFIDDAIVDLPEMFRRGEICKRLIALPTVSDDVLRRLDREDMLRLNMAYGFLAYSFRFAWENGRERLLHQGEAWFNADLPEGEDQFAPTKGTVARIRSSILLPWRTLRQQMGREQPCFEADFFTRNFRVKDGNYVGPESVGQSTCDLLFRFFGSETERVFFLGVQEANARFHCLPALVRVQRAMMEQDHEAVIAAVDQISSLWHELVEDVFMRFDTRIDPADWAATVGTWTASPFPARDGFSGLFFPAFHMLDVLLGRVHYGSMMGKLILHTRGELLPAWRELFTAIGAADLRTYCDAHGRNHPELVRALMRLQDAYQHFFLVHRRKVFAFEYQGIVTGRNSTNAGISVDIQDRTVESVFNLATWNEIDDILVESAVERPLEQLAPTPSKCPFSGGGMAEKAPKTYPVPVASRCPFSSGAAKAAPATTTAEPERVELPDWRPLRQAPGAPPFHGIEVATLPVPPRAGDRVALWLDAEGKRKVEADFVGPLQAPYVIRTPAPITEVHRVEILNGLFARQPGAGVRSRDTQASPVLVIAQGRHSVLATTLAPHTRGELFVVVEGEPLEKEILASRGVPSRAVVLTSSLDHLTAADVSSGCGFDDGKLRALRDDVLIYISGNPEFVKRANAWLAAELLDTDEPFTKFLSELRVSKRYRPLVQEGPAAGGASTVMYPWDVLGARGEPLRVVLSGRVLDLTEFQAVHYGGTPIIKMLAGTDVTSEFSRAHPDNQVRMPEVHTVASFSVPAGLERLTHLAFIITRSANVLDLLDGMLAPYRDAPRLSTQRLWRVLLALDIETLWSQALAAACGTKIDPALQRELRANHARSLEVLETSLRSSDPPELATVFAQHYRGLYEDVVRNLVRGLRESVTTVGKPADMAILGQCFDRHVKILRGRAADPSIRPAALVSANEITWGPTTNARA